MLGEDIDSEYAVTSLNDVTESNEVKLQEKNQENVSVTHIENNRREFSEFPLTKIYLSDRHISILHGFCLHGSPSSCTGNEAVEVSVTFIPYCEQQKFHKQEDMYEML